MKIRAGIIGGAGYTGGEMIRILINHPEVEIAFAHSKSNAGKFLYEVHEDLAGETDLTFAADWHNDIDVLFLCVGHGEAKKFLEGEGGSGEGGGTGTADAKATRGSGSGSGPAKTALVKVRIIDLSQDYRLHGDVESDSGKDGGAFVYGLPELNRNAIRKAHHIANPGCFATAIQLGLLPLAKAGLLGEVYTTGITGSTGAGQGLSPTSHFSWRANNIQAYKTLTHQHLKEVVQSLQQLQPGFSQDGGMDGAGAAAGSWADGGGKAAARGGIHFVPWRGDFTRGIFVSSQLRCDRPLAGLETLYQEYYRDHPFTVVSRGAISLKQVVNNNKCLIQLEQQGDRLVIHSAIDNLLKGASGQAVQNMNLMFGLDETAGLHLKANAF